MEKLYFVAIEERNYAKSSAVMSLRPKSRLDPASNNFLLFSTNLDQLHHNLQCLSLAGAIFPYEVSDYVHPEKIRERTDTTEYKLKESEISYALYDVKPSTIHFLQRNEIVHICVAENITELARALSEAREAPSLEANFESSTRTFINHLAISDTPTPPSSGDKDFNANVSAFIRNLKL